MRILPLFSLSALLLATGCVSAPRPAAVPSVRVVAPPPPAAPIVRPTDWRDWPQTPGDWRYERDGGGSVARFGEGAAPGLVVRCAGGSISLEPGGTGPVTIRTTSLSRVVAPDAASGITLAARDPLLDAIGFSRGRFVVERTGIAPLVLPAWPEIERVVEDCRS